MQGLHNLCVVLVERGRLKAASLCLRRAALLAPREAYVRRHLTIVLQRLARDSAHHPKHNYQIDAFLKEEDPAFNTKHISEDFQEEEPEETLEDKSLNANPYSSNNIPREEEVVRFDSFFLDKHEAFQSDGDDPSSGMS